MNIQNNELEHIGKYLHFIGVHFPTIVFAFRKKHKWCNITTHILLTSTAGVQFNDWEGGLSIVFARESVLVLERIGQMKPRWAPH